MLITMVIAGILFITVSMIIMYANESWLKAQKISGVLSDSRAGKKTIEYQVRSAITVPADFMYSTSEPFTMASSSDSFSITPDANGGQQLTFNVIDRNANSYKLDRFRYDNSLGAIVYDYWYATTNPPHPTSPPYTITYSGASTSTIVIINDAQGMMVSPIGDPGSPADGVKVIITQSKKLIGGSSETMLSTTTFSIKARNLRK